MRNNYRFDLSDYLIHFFRDVDLDGPNSIAMPEHMGWHSLYEDTHLPAIFMMRAALRNGRIWATWSYRNEIRTIYGPYPAVCFTDMPIAAFVEASQLRHARGEAMGEVALVFPKQDMRRQGALPVIYGLSQDPPVWPKGLDGGPRIFPSNILSLEEQFRHVSDVSSPGLQIDWTHEREWRWPFRGNAPEPQVEGCIADWSEIPGLDLYSTGISGIGAIVRTRSQADLIISDMLTLVDSGVAQEHEFSFVLVTDDLPELQSIQEPGRLAEAIDAATIDLAPYFAKDDVFINRVSRRFAHAVTAIETNAGPEEFGEFGGCWLWLHDGTSQLARSLIHANRVFVTQAGRYLARLYEFSDGRSLRQRQAMTQQLSLAIREEFGVDCCYFSVLNSDDPDAVPFYAEVDDDEIAFFNNSWNYD